MNDYFSVYLIYISVFLQMIGLTFAAIIDSYISKKHRTVINRRILFGGYNEGCFS